MLVILVGPSGSGKSTIEKILEAEHGFARIVSHTTRPPRPGEVNGVDYYFVSEEEFLAAPMAEQAFYDGHCYGVSVQELEAKIAQGDAVVTCEPYGAKTIKSMFSEAVTIFLDVPPAVRRYRMVYDRKMPIEQAERRLRSDEQVFKNFRADYVVSNDGAVEIAVKRILNIAQHNQVKRAEPSNKADQKLTEGYYTGMISAEQYANEVLKGVEFDRRRIEIEKQAKEITRKLIKKGLLR